MHGPERRATERFGEDKCAVDVVFAGERLDQQPSVRRASSTACAPRVATDSTRLCARSKRKFPQESVRAAIPPGRTFPNSRPNKSPFPDGPDAASSLAHAL